MILGVQTHFSQGWDVSWLERAKELGISDIRDSQPWSAVEKTLDVYNFPSSLVDYMARADTLGIGSLLTFASTNTLFDSGHMPYTDTGRQAYADYIVAVLDKYGDSVKQIEIWNEFNGYTVVGPAALDKSKAYTDLLRVTYETVKASHPNVIILGGSSNVIGTGYLEGLFKLGALNYMDGVAVHPYRYAPEHVDDELNHLTEVMGRYGGAKPIYATEFGNQFSDASAAPDYMVKMVAMMSSAHVAESYWYALQDQRWFSNMGLYDQSGQAKPAAAAFQFIQKHLLPLGDAKQIETGDSRTSIYKFGADTYVMWGAPRNITFTGSPTFYNSMGAKIDDIKQVGPNPVIVSGTFDFTLGTSSVVADSFLDYGEGEWQYYAKTADGVLHQLSLVDWDWTSYMGGRWYKPLRINADSLAPAGDASNPVQAVSRYTSTKDQRVEITGTWDVGPDGDGIDLHLLLNGREILSKIFVGEFKVAGLKIDLKAGDFLDFAVGPNQQVTGDSTSYHIKLSSVEEPVNFSDAHAPPLISKLPIEPAVASDSTTEQFVDVAIYQITLSGKQTRAVGSDFDDVLTGNALANWLYGKGGSDSVFGRSGNDFLYGEQGSDTISGGSGNDVISGGSGNDHLSGGPGNDALNGAAGEDNFIFSTKFHRVHNVDKINGFTPKDDAICLDHRYFSEVSKSAATEPQKIGRGAFWVGSNAHDRSDRIIYDKDAGTLSYDSDGTGPNAAIMFALIGSKLKLTHHDFYVI